MLAILRWLGERRSDFSEEYIPDPYVIAIHLPFIAAVTALTTEASPQQAMRARDRRVLTLLPFMASNAVLSMAGDTRANAP